MNYKAVAHRQRRMSVVEAVTFGLAYGSGLYWASVCLVGIFRPDRLSDPYWDAIPHMRTDTSGIVAFFLVALFLPCSEFLRLRRRWASAMPFDGTTLGGMLNAALSAVCETIALLATGLVIYLSFNTITHPITLGIQATHLASWPTEGTLRVIALLLCVCAVALLRLLQVQRSALPEGSHPTPVGSDIPPQ